MVQKHCTQSTDLLPLANFQKGCINFNNKNEMPIEIVRELIIDCSSFDLAKMREEYLKSKKSVEIVITSH